MTMSIATDFSVECKDGSIVNVHKNIFLQNCPSLQQELLKENQEHVKFIKFSNSEPKAVRAVILFIYTGRLEDIEGIENDVLEISKKLQVVGLMEMCSEQIQEKLSIDSALKILIFSYEKGFDALKESSIKFIVENLKQIRQHETWHLLNKFPDLVMELLCHIAN